MFTVSPEFRTRITSVWGEEGRDWLERLPGLVTTCTERWNLSFQSPVPGLSYNFVARVVKADGAEAILKIGVPDTELMTEIEALQIYQGRGVVKLLEADRRLGAFLLERLVPGKPLSMLADDDEATFIAAQVMRKLPRPEPVDHEFPTISKWTLAFDRLRTQFAGQTGLLPCRLVEKAERLFQEFQASSSGQMLLHGDLHHDNILSQGENSWLAIDPKGVIGDAAYEAARFQHNPIPRFLAMDQPRQVALRRAEIIASILRVDRSRLLAWAFFDIMLSACWSVEDHEEWRDSIACAELFDTIID